MLKKRIFTAIVLLGLTGYAIFKFSVPAFAYLALLVVSLVAWEWTQLIPIKKWYWRLSYVLFIVLLCMASIASNAQAIFYLSLFWWMLAWLWMIVYPKQQENWSKPWMIFLLGTQMIVPCWLGLIYLKQAPHSHELILFLIGFVSMADSGAYFMGRFLGKTPFAQKISPKKTREGLWGGLSAALLFTIAFLIYQKASWQYNLAFLSLAMIMFVFAVLGDLFESMLKRKANLKDIGSCLPGHGGFLDRVDSLLAVTPVYYIGLKIIAHWIH